MTRFRSISARIFFSLAAAAALSSCSPANFWSANAGYGALGGTLIGSGVGAYIGQENGNMTSNVIANGLIGTVGGVLAGGVFNAVQPVDNSMADVVERRAVYINSNQAEIDAMRQQVDDAGRWGRNEEKPWDERYLGSNPNVPYQGPGIQYERYIDSH